MIPKSRTPRTWLDDKGDPLPLEECTKEQLIDRFRRVVENHADYVAGAEGAMEALRKRLRNHRKAKAEANKRADQACAAMKAMIEHFEKR